MAIVGVDSGSLYRRTHSLSRLAWFWVGGHLALFCIHHMNRVNSRNGSACHDDSAINIDLELLLFITVSNKNATHYFYNNFDTYRPTVIILSLLHSAMTAQTPP